jgi:hypothetical protein
VWSLGERRKQQFTASLARLARARRSGLPVLELTQELNRGNATPYSSAEVDALLETLQRERLLLVREGVVTMLR